MKIYDGGSKYSDLIKSMNGTYKNEKVSIPGNQMYIAYETRSTIAKKGFKAFILEKGIFKFLNVSIYNLHISTKTILYI